MFWGTGDVKKFVSFRYCWLGHAFINVVIHIYCFVLSRIKKDIRYKNLELKHCLHLSWNVHIFYELSFHFVTVCVFLDVFLYIRFISHLTNLSSYPWYQCNVQKIYSFIGKGNRIHFNCLHFKETVLFAVHSGR